MEVEAHESYVPCVAGGLAWWDSQSWELRIAVNTYPEPFSWCCRVCYQGLIDGEEASSSKAALCYPMPARKSGPSSLPFEVKTSHKHQKVLEQATGVTGSA